MTVNEAFDTTTPFSEVIKSASWEVHERAERSPFIRRLLAGEAAQSEYADMVAQHYFAYCVLEDAAVALAGDPVASQFGVPELFRRDALERDLAALLGPDWPVRIAPNAGTVEYVQRIRDHCFDWPAGFVAHHYVRYLGDLSGGQIIKRILARTYGFSNEAGISFYDFDMIDNGVQFKKRYRALLDTAPWDADERDRMVGEVVVAFELNAKVLEHLDR